MPELLQIVLQTGGGGTVSCRWTLPKWDEPRWLSRILTFASGTPRPAGYMFVWTFRASRVLICAAMTGVFRKTRQLLLGIISSRIQAVKRGH